MFSEQESLIMIMAVVPEGRKWSRCWPDSGRCSTAIPGVMFVSDVAVSRRDYFGKSAKS